MFYDGQKMYHQMQGVGGWGNESLSSLVEPRDGGGPEGAIIRNEETGQKKTPPLSIRNSQLGHGLLENGSWESHIMTLRARLGRRQSNARLPEHFCILDVCCLVFVVVLL